MKKLLLGDEAIAQAAIDAGLSGVYAYKKLLWKKLLVCHLWASVH